MQDHLLQISYIAFYCKFRALMEFHLLPIFAFLCLALPVSHASHLPSEVYWKTVLPNTPMPKAISHILLPVAGEQSTTFHVSPTVDRLIELRHSGYAYSRATPGAATAEQLRIQNDLNEANMFLLEKDLHPASGLKMKLHFAKIKDGATFLPHKVAESIPFSSKTMEEILNRFSVKPKSAEAQIMKETIGVCEAAAIAGEKKYCATSLESLIDFSTSEVGPKVEIFSTEVERTGTREYKIGGRVKMVGKNPVVCHKLNYACAVFYCHSTHGTRTYMVSLVDDEGKKSNAMAICHTDTSAWNPNHFAFRVLKVKPGTLPICHFLPNSNIVWVSN